MLTQFEGDMQHDAQEFLSYLIDVLHEDLNRVLRKPYMEGSSIKPGQDEDEYFQKLIEGNRERNNSIMTELFFGMFKAITHCTQCTHQSVNFEPYNMLTVPVVKPRNSKMMSVYYVCEASLYDIVKFEVSISEDHTFASIKKSICEKKRVEVDCVHFYEFDRKSFTLMSEEDANMFHYEKKAEVFIFLVEDISDILRSDGEDVITVFYDPKHVKKDAVVGVKKLVRCSKKQRVMDVYIYFYNVLKKMLPFFLESFEVEFSSPQSTQPFLLHIDDCSIPYSEDGVDPQRLIEMKNNDTIVVELRHNLTRGSRWTDLDIKTDTIKSLQTSIYDCMEAFTQQEVLDEDNKWYCSKCKSHQMAKRELKLKVLPHILIIHLKRFKKTTTGFLKLDDIIDFPIEGLDLSPYTTNPDGTTNRMKYNLFAIVSHQGTLFKGHYISYVRTVNNQLWVKFDDELCSNVKQPHELINNQPYILFYRRESNQ